MKKIIGLVLLFITAVTTAQDIKITGKVIDTLGTPLQMANVIAYQQDKNLGAFGITNADGDFQLKGLKVDSTYTIKVSYLGMKPYEEKIEKLKKDLKKIFILESAPDELDAVNITYQMPVSIKGDTIVYDADSFTNGNEEKLGDVLQKLPGVEVNEDGDITVEGVQVEKVKVEGKDFFEGDSRLATKNIPADAVSKVEVLKNYNNQSQLKGLGNDQDRIAINIRLKEGKKKFWFGEATVGAGHGGNDERYLVQPKAFFYSEDFSINILTDFNNLGVPAFTGRDYYRFTGFGRRDTRASGSSINVGSASSFSPVATNRAQEIISKFGAANASWTVSDKLDMSAFAIISSSDTDTRRISRNLFIASGDEQNTDQTSFERNLAGVFKLGGEYKPNSNFTLNYDGRFNITDEQQFSTLQSDLDSDIQGSLVEDTTQDTNQNPYTFNQQLNMYYTAGENHIFALESTYLNQEEDPFYNAIRSIDNGTGTTPEPFNGTLNLQQADPYNINQERFVTTNKLDAKLDYWYVLNKKSNLNFTVGSTFSTQNFDSDIFQITNDGSRNELQDLRYRNDDVEYNFTDLYAGVHYKFITGKFTITPGFTAHSFKTRDKQLGTVNTINTERILPDLNVRYEIRSSERLNLDYNQNVTFSDIDNYALGLVFNNYNRLNSGNNQLEGAVNDRVSLRYSNFNMFNYTMIFAGVTYTNRRDAIQSQVQLDGIEQVSAPINAILPNESLTAYGNYGKEFGKIQANLNVNITWLQNNNIINGDNLEATNFLHTYRLTGRSNYKDGVNFDLGYTLGFNDSDNGQTVNNSTTHTINANIDWEIGKRWLLRTGYDYNIFNATGGIENTFDFLDASLRYQKPGSRWEYSLVGTNLLNADTLVNNSFGQIATSTTQTFVLPRYIYFQMKFDL